MIVVMFNGSPSTVISSCYNPTNANNKTDIITFYNELSFFVRSTRKQNVLIIGVDINAQMGKN